MTTPFTDADDSPGKPTVSAEEGSVFETLRNLWPYMWPADRPDLKRRVLMALLSLMMAMGASVLAPWFYSRVVDSLGPGGDAGAGTAVLGVTVVVALIIAYGLGTIIESLFMQLRDVLFASVGQHAVRNLAHRTFVHMHLLSLRYHLQRRTGALSRVIERGTKGIETIVRFTMLNTAPTLVQFALISVIFSWRFGFWYLAILVLIVVAYIYFTIKASNWRIGIRRKMNDSDTDANFKAVDSLLNFETVKYFGNEEMEAQRYDQSMEIYEGAATRMWSSLGVLNFGQAVIFWSGMIIVSIMAAQSVVGNAISVGDFVLINMYMMQIYRPLNFIGFVYREIRQGLTDIEEMFKLLDQDAEIRDKSGAKKLKIAKPEVRFDNVVFHYEPDRQILNGISFAVPAGKTVAIVGPSGAGKSTISRLIYRFYDPVSGQIEIDGQDLRDVTQKSLRAAVGMVPQDTVLFNDTIAYNICYGRPGASDADVEEAARLAQIHDFIQKLPKGYQTPVGERGLKLSGGEKQRVAIARTILKSPPILILDEATSALDTQTEREIQSALDHVSQGRTTLVIAHRLSTVINADEIIVLNAGKIAERGTHEQLLSLKGLYEQMWHRQRELDEASQQLRMARERDARDFALKQ